MTLMGSLTPEGIQFSIDQYDKIIEYAEVDANLTARIAWKIVHGFESNGVRMSRPYSPASVAERAALDRCNIPTMNTMIAQRYDHVLFAWSAYQVDGSSQWVKDIHQRFSLMTSHLHILMSCGGCPA